MTLAGSLFYNTCNLIIRLLINRLAYCITIFADIIVITTVVFFKNCAGRLFF